MLVIATLRRWFFPVWCIGCGDPETALCAACSAAERTVTVAAGGITVRAASAYDGHVRAAILALKSGERAYLAPLAAMIAPLVPLGSAIVPLCTSRRRAAERGFDQARELAQRVATVRSGWVDDVLQKRGSAQRGLGRSARLGARGRFAVRDRAEVPSTAVVLDDVFTTGATLRDAVAALADAGCCVTAAVVIARTR